MELKTFTQSKAITQEITLIIAVSPKDTWYIDFFNILGYRTSLVTSTWYQSYIVINSPRKIPVSQK